MLDNKNNFTNLDFSLYSTHEIAEHTCLEISNSITRNHFVAMTMVLFNLAKHGSVNLPHEEEPVRSEENHMLIEHKDLLSAVYCLIEGRYVSPSQSCYSFGGANYPSAISTTPLLDALFNAEGWFKDGNLKNREINDDLDVIDHEHEFVPPIALSAYIYNDKVKSLEDFLSKDIGVTHRNLKKALVVVLLNLVMHDSLLINRAKSAYTRNRYKRINLGHTAFTKTIDALVQGGYLYQLIGNRYGKNLYRTKVVKRSKLTALFEEYEWLVPNENGSPNLVPSQVVSITPDIESIVLKSKSESGHKTVVDYKDTGHSHALRKKMDEYNSLLSRNSITDHQGNDMHKDIGVFRSFRRYRGHNFNYGGRIYGPWCSMPSKKRDKILINGEETVEVDIPASHINICYLKETGAFYTDGDPYELFVNESRIPRSVVKQISNTLFFTGSIPSATSSIVKFYAGTENEANALEFCEAKRIAQIKLIIQSYLEKHKVIEKWLMISVEVGMKVQYLESEFIMRVVNSLASQNEVVLTVYDSVICSLKNEERVREMLHC